MILEKTNFHKIRYNSSRLKYKFDFLKMKYIFLIIGLVFFFLGCSNDDNSNQMDHRFKFYFDSDVRGTIIGEDTNEVIKYIYPDKNFSSCLDFSYNENSGNFYFFIKDYFTNSYVYHKANIHTAFESDDYSYPTEEITIPLLNDEKLLKTFISKEENIYLIAQDISDSSVLNYYLKEIKNNQVIDSINITSGNFVSGHLNYFYLKNQDQIFVLNDDNEGVNIDLNSQTISSLKLPSSLNIFNIIDSPTNAYIISRTEQNYQVYEYIYDIEGNEISMTEDFIGRSAIGYDSEDSKFEYVQVSDGRKEAGDINISTGSLDYKAIKGTPYSNDSDLFFFNRR